MTKIFMSGAILFFCCSGNPCFSQSSDNATTTATNAPSEVGSTTMAPGQYTLIDDNAGKKYSLMVTSKGTMVLGPAQSISAAAQTKKPGGLEGMAESQMKKQMTNMVEKEGVNEFKGLIK